MCLCIVPLGAAVYCARPFLMARHTSCNGFTVFSCGQPTAEACARLLPRRWGRWGQVQRNSSIHGCAARRAHVAEGGSHVFTNEYTLQGGLRDVRGAHLCPQLVNVVMIRWGLGDGRHCVAGAGGYPTEGA